MNSGTLEAQKRDHPILSQAIRVVSDILKSEEWAVVGVMAQGRSFGGRKHGIYEAVRLLGTSSSDKA